MAPHEVESLFYMGSTPWHGLGTKVTEALTFEEAIRKAGLDWDVIKEPIYTEDKVQVPRFQAIRRTDNKLILGVVGNRYEPLQNLQAFKFFDKFISTKECTFESAGSLRQGKRIFVLAKLNRAPMFITKTDSVDKFLLLSNSHDGTQAIRVGFTSVRVVCANTLAAAHESNASKLLRVYHTKDAQITLDGIQEVINTANESFEANGHQYRSLVTKAMSQEDLEKYIRIVFYNTERVAETPRAEAHVQTLINKIKDLHINGLGSQLDGSQNTMWGAYNSINEYLNYQAGRSKDTRLDSLWFGQHKTLNERALNVAIQW